MLRVVMLLLTMAAPTLALAAEGAAMGAVCVENASITELQDALAAGTTTAVGLVRAYTVRIESGCKGAW